MSATLGSFVAGDTRSPFARLLLIGGLLLLLQIPACQIAELQRARSATRDEAVKDIAKTWAGRQSVAGPYLVVPFRTRDARGAWSAADEAHPLVITPATLDFDGAASAEARRRGVFEIPVYRAELKLRGHFDPPRADAGVLEASAAPQWDRAQLVLLLADPRALEHPPQLHWRGQTIALQPGAGLAGGAGLHAPLPELAADLGGEFEIQLATRGSGGLYFSPVGRDTHAALRSPWPHPDFEGGWLPASHEIGAQGFSAEWNVPFVARGLPASWVAGSVPVETLSALASGVEFVYPVDPYRMSERSLKYCVLFIGLTFLTVWLFEVRTGTVVHPLQYFLIGCALCLFYLLELTLAEQLGFGLAYALASTAVTLQVSLYGRAALKGGSGALLLCAASGTLYGLLFLLLREEDSALLIGSFALFVVLSAVMFLTRRLAPAPRVIDAEVG